MKNIWKWILGVLIVMVVVIALIAVPFFMHNYWAVNANNLTQSQGWYGNPMMRGFDGWQGRGGFDGHGPMMGGRLSYRGFGLFEIGFVFLGGLLRLVPWALFGLLIYSVYQFGKRAGARSNVLDAPAATPSPAPEPPVQQVADGSEEKPAG